MRLTLYITSLTTFMGLFMMPRTFNSLEVKGLNTAPNTSNLFIYQLNEMDFIILVDIITLTMFINEVPMVSCNWDNLYINPIVQLEIKGNIYVFLLKIKTTQIRRIKIMWGSEDVRDCYFRRSQLLVRRISNSRLSAECLFSL